MKNSIYNTNVYFKNSYEPEWIDAELAKKMIKDIDDSEVLSGECINSPVLGQIPPERLSGGVKTLLLILNEPDRIFNASTCVNNPVPVSLLSGDSTRIFRNVAPSGLITA